MAAAEGLPLPYRYQLTKHGRCSSCEASIQIQPISAETSTVIIPSRSVRLANKNRKPALAERRGREEKGAVVYGGYQYTYGHPSDKHARVWAAALLRSCHGDDPDLIWSGGVLLSCTRTHIHTCSRNSRGLPSSRPLLRPPSTYRRRRLPVALLLPFPYRSITTSFCVLF